MGQHLSVVTLFYGARLMQQITEEYEAAQHGLVNTAPHAFIITRVENMGKLQEELQ